MQAATSELLRRLLDDPENFVKHFRQYALPWSFAPDQH